MSTTTPKSILVTGATGRQGGALIDALLSQPDIEEKFKIFALTRDINTPRAQKLLDKSPGVIKLVQGDLNSPGGIFRNINIRDSSSLSSSSSPSYSSHDEEDHVWGVFSMQDKDSKVHANYLDPLEVKQAFGLIDEAIKHNVQYFVYTSGDRGGDALSWTNETYVPHFKTKLHIEQYLLSQIQDRESSMTMRWTILRPTMFYENLQTPNTSFGVKMFMTAYRDTLGPEKRCQRILTKDTAGDEFTFRELDEVFKSVTGKGVPPTWGLLGSVMKIVARNYGLMLDWFDSDGYGADIEKVREIHPGLMSLKEWMKEKSVYHKKA
ncbi:uncharacterized protein I303_106352 [Kwoniella dejecticola CBS 10117]|uniref:NmrA-like domain-containing protein n=1 Tax=Kwoniella dejecticola CBS 10117 TaxID=1296121 RepID=A0A1A5ZUZ1_9TREE|nr:uncharacterized protein I303_08391 [Kwoniella dejecticola CBS 10117]OBR81620.1 hypothetical protein I303_08391 [Kwoniella dejecticola CBS 10117]